MAQSTAAVLIGVYGLVRGLFGLLFGIVAVAGGAILGGLGSAVGSGAAAGAGGIVMLMGVLLIVGSVVMWVASIALFVEKSWAPVLTFVAFGLVTLSWVLSVIAGGNIAVLGLVILGLDIVCTGWGAMNAPQVPIGNSPRQPQAA